MNIGDELVMRPSICASRDEARPKLMPCRVVYIHPQRRFYTVEFRSEITGAVFRESFPCTDRPDVVHEPPQYDAADKRKQFGPASLRRGGIYTKG